MPRRRPVEKWLGERIREQRKRIGLSLAEFARLVGTSRSQVDEVEKGERDPGFATLVAFAKELKVDLATLVTRDDELPAVQPHDKLAKLVLEARARGPQSIRKLTPIVGAWLAAESGFHYSTGPQRRQRKKTPKTATPSAPPPAPPR